MITATPFNVCDSICSISFTIVVMPRSLLAVMRLDISCAERPEYCHTVLTTGILIFGKMSVGVLIAAVTPKMTISIAMTTNV